ncbi:MAG: caspase family protein [Candidatus Omnitrophica bacterium]|nr:hypothetical protein [bacterium]NUN96787.1 caspase family protein [Candidatus Omnitrophota bacterium]
MKPSALVVAVFLLLLNFPAVADRKALVVGIDEFQNPKVRPLACCVNDAGAYRDLLIGGFGFRSEEIRFLTNGEATREGILASLNALAEGAGEGDIRVFIFAGHGTRVRDKSGDEADGDGLDEALVPNDALAMNALILDDEIQAALEKAPRAEWTVLLDCCHAGTATKDLLPDAKVRSRFTPATAFEEGNVEPSGTAGTRGDWRETGIGEEGGADGATLDPVSGATRENVTEEALVVVFAACQPEEKALEDSDSGHGRFTRHLLKGFEEGALQPGASVFSEVAEYFKVTFEGEEAGKPVRQNPFIELPPAMEGKAFIASATPGQAPPIRVSTPSGKKASSRNLVFSGGEEPPVSDFEVRLYLPAGRVLTEGDLLDVVVKSEAPGYLTLLSWWSDGTVTQLFPNQFQPDNRIPEDVEVRIPKPGQFRLRITPPFGLEWIEAVVTDSPWQPEAFGATEFKGGIKTLPAEKLKGLPKEIEEIRANQRIAHALVGFETRPRVGQ